MQLENVSSIEAVRTMYGQLESSALVGQQIGLRASIHTVEYLIAQARHGATPEIILQSLREQLHVLHEVAYQRGIQLLTYR